MRAHAFGALLVLVAAAAPLALLGWRGGWHAEVIAAVRPVHAAAATRPSGPAATATAAAAQPDAGRAAVDAPVQGVRPAPAFTDSSVGSVLHAPVVPSALELAAPVARPTLVQSVALATPQPMPQPDDQLRRPSQVARPAHAKRNVKGAERAAAGARKKPVSTPVEAAFHAALQAQRDALDGAHADPHALAGAAPRAPDSIGGFPFLMLLGTSKGGSTFLFACMQEAFHPRVVCGADDAAAWSRERCGARRFLLAGLRASVVLSRRHPGVSVPAGPLSLRINPIKENYVLTRGMYRGPRVEPERTRFYRGPALPLDLWEARNKRVHSEPGRVRAWLDALLRSCARSIGDGERCPVRDFRDLGQPYSYRGLAAAREGEACGFFRAPPPADAAHANVSVGRLCAHRGPDYLNRIFSEVRAFAPPPLEGAPPTRPWESRLLSFDGCPYNLGSAQAPSILQHMLDRAAVAAAMRFIVLVRDPVDRAYSEWAMTNRWGDKMHVGGTFGAHAREQVRLLEACVGGRMRALVRGEMGDAEFSRVYERCIDADYYAYVKNSLYGLHLRNWLRYFRAEAFLLLETERMAHTPPAELLRRIASFVGLHFDEAAALATGPFAHEVNATCSPHPRSQRAPNLKADGSLRTPVDERTRRWLRAFFFQGERPWMHMVPPQQLRKAHDDAAAGTTPAR